MKTAQHGSDTLLPVKGGMSAIRATWRSERQLAESAPWSMARNPSGGFGVDLQFLQWMLFADRTVVPSHVRVFPIIFQAVPAVLPSDTLLLYAPQVGVQAASPPPLPQPPHRHKLLIRTCSRTKHLFSALRCASLSYFGLDWTTASP